MSDHTDICICRAVMFCLNSHLKDILNAYNKMLIKTVVNCSYSCYNVDTDI